MYGFGEAENKVSLGKQGMCGRGWEGIGWGWGGVWEDVDRYTEVWRSTTGW